MLWAGRGSGGCDGDRYRSFEAAAERVVYLEKGGGEAGWAGGRRCKEQADVARNAALAAQGRVDLGKGQRHLPIPSDCHPGSQHSAIQLKERQ